ncbi:MAG: hypothetical protein LBN31_13185 [Hungatella sp.]|jgi:hypothetical protein|nr:hypothetical protein [Hungatella sp.]
MESLLPDRKEPAMLEKFLLSLDIMWKGMLSIFVVIIIITLLIMGFRWVEKILLDKKDEKGKL